MCVSIFIRLMISAVCSPVNRGLKLVTLIICSALQKCCMKRVRTQGGGQEPCPPRRTRLRPPTTHIPALPQPRGKQVGLVSLQSIMLRPGARRVVLLSAVTLVARVGPKGPSPKGCLWGGRTHVLVSPQHGERSIELCMCPKMTEPSQSHGMVC